MIEIQIEVEDILKERKRQYEIELQQNRAKNYESNMIEMLYDCDGDTSKIDEYWLSCTDLNYIGLYEIIEKLENEFF